MRQFILPEEWEGEPECTLAGGRAKYLCRVLRLGLGDRFAGMDKTGRRWLCTVLELGKQGESLRLGVERLPPEAESGELRDLRGGRGSSAIPKPASGRPETVAMANRIQTLPPITLVQGLPKGAKMDLVVRQAVEVGVQRILPLLSLRCLPQVSAEASARLGRWRRIVREALQQSGSRVSTRVEAPIGLPALGKALSEGVGTALADRSPGPAGKELRLLLHETPLAQSSLHEYLTETPTEIVVCVGPEGGFAEEETAYLRNLGFLPLHLAGAVLRSETAALYAVAAVEIVLSERSSWMPKPR